MSSYAVPCILLLIYEFLDRRSFQIRYAASLNMVLAMCFNVLMFRLALSSRIYFLLFETPIATLWSSWAPKHVLWQRVFRSASEFKVRNLMYCMGHFTIYVRWLFGWRYISSLHGADEVQEGRNSCPLLRSCFIGSCRVGVSKRFSRSISLAVYCLSSTAVYYSLRF